MTSIARHRIDELTKEIRDHQFRYYVLDAPTIISRFACTLWQCSFGLACLTVFCSNFSLCSSLGEVIKISFRSALNSRESMPFMPVLKICETVKIFLSWSSSLSIIFKGKAKFPFEC